MTGSMKLMTMSVMVAIVSRPHKLKVLRLLVVHREADEEVAVTSLGDVSDIDVPVIVLSLHTVDERVLSLAGHGLDTSRLCHHYTGQHGG